MIELNRSKNGPTSIYELRNNMIMEGASSEEIASAVETVQKRNAAIRRRRDALAYERYMNEKGSL